MLPSYATYIGCGHVTVFDSKKNIFFEQNQPSPFYFNLIDGNFTYTGDVRQSSSRLVYDVSPPKDIVRLPKDVKVEFSGDVNMAELHVDSGLIKIENTYLNTPRYILHFFYFHEWAHFLYPSKNGDRTKENELKCDLFSSVMMLLKGYNPVQVIMAIEDGVYTYTVIDGKRFDNPDMVAEKKFRVDGLLYFLKGLTFKLSPYEK